MVRNEIKIIPRTFKEGDWEVDLESINAKHTRLRFFPQKVAGTDAGSPLFHDQHSRAAGSEFLT